MSRFTDLETKYTKYPHPKEIMAIFKAYNDLPPEAQAKANKLAKEVRQPDYQEYIHNLKDIEGGKLGSSLMIGDNPTPSDLVSARLLVKNLGTDKLASINKLRKDYKDYDFKFNKDKYIYKKKGTNEWNNLDPEYLGNGSLLDMAKEALLDLGDTARDTAVGAGTVAGTTTGAGLGAAAGTPLGPLGTLLGGIGGGYLGGATGSALTNLVADTAARILKMNNRTVGEDVKGAVTRGALDSALNLVLNVASGATKKGINWLISHDKYLDSLNEYAKKNIVDVVNAGAKKLNTTEKGTAQKYLNRFINQPNKASAYTLKRTGGVNVADPKRIATELYPETLKNVAKGAGTFAERLNAGGKQAGNSISNTIRDISNKYPSSHVNTRDLINEVADKVSKDYAERGISGSIGDIRKATQKIVEKTIGKSKDTAAKNINNVFLRIENAFRKGNTKVSTKPGVVANKIQDAFMKDIGVTSLDDIKHLSDVELNRGINKFVSSTSKNFPKVSNKMNTQSIRKALNNAFDSYKNAGSDTKTLYQLNEIKKTMPFVPFGPERTPSQALGNDIRSAISKKVNDTVKRYLPKDELKKYERNALKYRIFGADIPTAVLNSPNPKRALSPYLVGKIANLSPTGIAEGLFSFLQSGFPLAGKTLNFVEKSNMSPYRYLKPAIRGSIMSKGSQAYEPELRQYKNLGGDYGRNFPSTK